MHQKIKVRLLSKNQDWSVNTCALPVKFHSSSGNLCKSLTNSSDIYTTRSFKLVCQHPACVCSVITNRQCS
jgi:hypothetical protein